MIFITTYDPFDRDRMVYTIRNCCVEEPDLPYEDGAETLFLYTKGTKGDPPQELRELLQYEEAGADSSWTQNVDGILVIRGNGEFADFLKVLADGKEIAPENYTADTTVIAPKTGDASKDALLAALAVVSFAGLAGMLVLKKRKCVSNR